jgi:predicted membrane GTPase involved in stress response
VAQGDARGARRERLMDVDDVERDRGEGVLDRARDIDR